MSRLLLLLCGSAAAALAGAGLTYYYYIKPSKRLLPPQAAAANAEEDLPEEFLQAVAQSKQLTQCSSGEMLALYGLYKRVTAGPLPSHPTAAGAPWEPTARAKYFAWEKASGISQEEAVAAYIALVKQLGGGTEVKPRTSMGPKVSTMMPPASTDQTLRDKELDLFDKLCNDFSQLNLCLLEANPDLLVMRDEDGRTLLHWAVDAECLDAVHLLASHALVDVNARDEDGLTPLAYACMSDMDEGICDALLQSGRADVKNAGGVGIPASSLVRARNNSAGLKRKLLSLEACLS